MHQTHLIKVKISRKNKKINVYLANITHNYMKYQLKVINFLK